MEFDYIVHVFFLPSHCGFLSVDMQSYFFFSCRLQSFFFFLMVIQQLVAIVVFLCEEVSSSFSIQTSYPELSSLFYFQSLLPLSLLCAEIQLISVLQA